MSCNACNRWGPGTTKEKIKNNEETKEFKIKMEQMLAERAKQDTMWTSSVSTSPLSPGGSIFLSTLTTTK